MTRDTLVLTLSLIAFLIAFAAWRINRPRRTPSQPTGVDDPAIVALFHTRGIDQ